MSITHKLQWRYAVKEFDASQTVSEEQVTELLQAINLAPTAFGLQPFEVFVIKDKGLQKQLVEYSYHQEKIHEASHVIVFAAHKTITDEYINAYVERTQKTRNAPNGSLDDFKNMMIDTFHNLSQDHHLLWSQRQVYLALGILLVAAADMKIDSCPMEGFVPEKYNELLELPENLHATVVIPIGYRSHKDTFQHLEKSRRELSDIVHLKYEKTEN